MPIQHRRIVWMIALTAFGLVILQLVPSHTLAAPPQSQSRSETPRETANDSASALIFPMDRQIEQSLDAVIRHLQTEEFVVAADLLKQILDSPGESFAGDAGMGPVVPSRNRALQLSQRLPADLRTRLEADLDRTARAIWTTLSLNGSNEEIVGFANTHRTTLSGLEALQRLAATDRDAGRHELAAVGFSHLVDHPRSNQALRTTAVLARITSLLAIERRGEAQETAIKHADLLNTKTPLTIGGRSVIPSQRVAEQLHESNREGREDAIPNSTIDASLRLPGLKPVWSTEMGAVAEIQKAIPGIQRYFREQGVVSSLAIRPVVAGNVVLARSMEDVSAYDVKTGEKLWSLPNQEYGWIAKSTGPLHSAGSNRPLLAGAWHRTIEADSVFNSLTTDGRLVVVVQQPDRSNIDFAGPPRPGSQNIPQTGVRWNRLFGYEVSSRELRWQIGGQPRGPADVFGGMAFLGAPLFVDDALFGMGRRDDELFLLAMDRDTGHLRWSVPLGIVPAHLADAVSRRRMACPITLVDGVLLCPTVSGSLVAVDPITRSVVWAFRYPVIQHDLPIRLLNGPAMQAQPDAWWNEWREVNCVTKSVSIPGANAGQPQATSQSRSVTIMVSPDSSQLHAVSTDDGVPLWSAARSGALYLTGVSGDQAIVLEPMAARSHDLRTGLVRWRAETGEISGRGAIVGQYLIQPRRAGGVAVIDLSNGSLRNMVADSEFVAGTLIPCDGGWITQTDQSLMRIPFLDTMRRQALNQWRLNGDEANAIILARLDLQSGDPAAARSRLESIATVPAKELRRNAIVAVLRSLKDNDATAVQNQHDREDLGRELLSLCESNEERLTALRTLGEAAWMAKDSIGAMTCFLEGLDLVDAIGLLSLGDWTSNEISSRTVRPDRVLLGAIEQILNDAEAGSRRPNGNLELLHQLESKLQRRLTAARSSQDPFAVQRIMDRLLPLEWGRRALVADPTPALFARPLAKVEPTLLSAMGSYDRTTSARAAYQLTELFVRSGWRNEAEAIERRLLVENPGMSMADGQTLSAHLAQDPAHSETRRRLLSSIADPWPDVIPTVERGPRQRPPNLDSSLHNYPIKIQTVPGSLLDRLDVSVDRRGQKARFAGDGHAEPWEIALAGTPRPLRSMFANFDLVEAYGVGRLLVLRLGSEVFGFLPLNDHGEPNIDKKGSQPSFQFDMASAGEFYGDPPGFEYVPEKAGIRSASFRVIDGLGHSLGGLGPVRAGYLCYRSQARLVAKETQTGRTLWERLDLPPNCQAFGDDERVYLWRIEERSLQVLSAIDGRLLEERAWNASPDDLLMQHDSRSWVAVRRPVPGIELIDARDGSTVWKRTFDMNSVPFAVDYDTLGVIEQSGLLHILSADSGAALGEALTIPVPEKIERIVCVHDAQRWYLAISGPVPRLPVLQAEQVWGGLHLAFVNGWLYGIDRESKTISWQRFLDSEAMPLEVSRNAPVLVQMWRKSIGDGMAGQNAEGILRVIDKRTGRQIDNLRDSLLQPYFALHLSDNCEMLQIYTERHTIRLNYKATTQETQQERASDKN